MEAISKKTGKVFTGKLAELMLRIGAASPLVEEVNETDQELESTAPAMEEESEKVETVEEVISEEEQIEIVKETIEAEKPEEVNETDQPAAIPVDVKVEKKVHRRSAKRRVKK